jgi:predicted transcriptional regulator
MRINKDLKLELQIIALKKNTTITAIINELIEDYVNENK